MMKDGVEVSSLLLTSPLHLQDIEELEVKREQKTEKDPLTAGVDTSHLRTFIRGKKSTDLMKFHLMSTCGTGTKKPRGGF